MKLRFSLLFWVLALPCICEAQWSGPAWNPRCYYPEVGNRTQIDTIFGPRPNADFALALKNIGPVPGGSYGTIAAIFPLGYPDPLPATSSFDGGPTLDLHALHLNKRLNFHLIGNIVKIGHFRDTYHSDILTSTSGGQARLYFEDDLGNYDSARFALLATRLSDGTIESAAEPGQVFCAHVTSDSVFDILYPFGIFRNQGVFGDSTGISLAAGGTHLKNFSDTILATSSAVVHCYVNDDQSPFERTIIGCSLQSQTGFLAQDREGNLFYGAARRGTTIAEIAWSLVYDTILPASSIKGIVPPTSLKYSIPEPFETHAFDKATGDSSTDLVYPINQNVNQYRTLMFRGSPHFGENRLTIDSAFILQSPSYYGASDFDLVPPSLMRDCGDMTGRGNHTLCVEYKTDPAYVAYCFYELGNQLDDKIDMFYLDGPMYNAGGYVDTITANGDHLQDVIIAEPGRYRTSGLVDANGTIQILYGTRDIPTRSVNRVSPEPGQTFSVYPTPLHGSTALLTIQSAQSEVIEAKVFDLLGRILKTQAYHTVAGLQELSLSLPDLPNGPYSIEMKSARGSQFQKLLIQR